MIEALSHALIDTGRDVLAVSALLIGFQYLVLRQPIPHIRRLAGGLVLVVGGLAFFLIGLELALFPVGERMARQLSSPAFVLGAPEVGASPPWWKYTWVYVFGAVIGFSTTLAEPALIAVATKASQASRGTIQPWGFRVVVALGVALGIALGTFRIVTGSSLVLFIGVGYVCVVVQTAFAPKSIIPLAYDSGGVTTSTVTVPLVTALGLGLASSIPGRNPALDGFGLIAFASLFPMITVMGYAQGAEWWAHRSRKKAKEG